MNKKEWTGFIDQEKNKILEGDIVEFPDKKTHKEDEDFPLIHTSVVYWDDQLKEYRVSFFFDAGKERSYSFKEIDLNKALVVGSIYDDSDIYC